MLNLESRMEILGITVFQDTDRANQFYYLPGNPHISRENGQFLFDLFGFRKGGEAGEELTGGFLNMAVDTGIGGLKDRIQGQLKERFGDDATLVVVPFTKGTTRVIGLGEDSQAVSATAAGETTPNGDPLVASGPRFIEKILGAGRPSLDGDNRTIFSFSLSEEGTAFFLGLLNGSPSARPLGIIYELEYTGLLPSYDLEITIDFSSVYEFLESRFSLGTLFFKADIDNITEELQRREAIKIRETARTLELSTAQAVQERQNRINQLVKDLASGALFQPSLVPGEPKVRTGVTTTADDPTETAPATALANTALQHGPSAAVAAGTATMLARHERAAQGEDGGQPADANGSGEQPPQGSEQPPQGGNQQPQTAADVWNRLGRPQAAFGLKNLRQEERRTVTYNLNQTTAQKATYAPQNLIQFMGSTRELNQRVHIIDLNHPFFERLNINVNAGSVDFAADGIMQMVVQLRYGERPDGTKPKDTAEVILRSMEDSKDFVFFTDRKRTLKYEYKLIVDYRNDFGIGVKDARVESDWITTEATSLSVTPGWLERALPVSVQLAPDTPEDVDQAQVRVRYANAARAIDDSTLLTLTRGGPTESIVIRVAGADERFEVAPTLFYTDGNREELPVLHLPDPARGDADDAVVISAPRSNLLSGDIIFQDPLDELKTVLVDTQVEQDNNVVKSASFELSGQEFRKTWSVRLPSRQIPPRLRFKERRLYKDGGLEQEEWRDAISNNLAVGIPAEGAMTVSVQYLGPDPSALNLDAIQLELDYQEPNEDPRFDQSQTFLITDDPESQTMDWKVRLPDRNARTYRWKATLLHSDGTETASEFRSDNRNPLPLRPPQ